MRASKKNAGQGGADGTVNLSDVQREELGRLLKRMNYGAAESLHGVAKPNVTPYAKFVKRAIDILLSALALLVTAPFNMLFAVLTYLDVGFPILFRQQRVGKDGRIFTIVKFRNMTNETDQNGNLLPSDRRVTRFGRFMRATSCDELLNFWSVLKGDMSIIGPRPLLPEYTERYATYHRARLSVRPGLECPQPLGKEDALDWEAQFNNDVWYVENISFKTDIIMSIRLILSVINRKTATVRGNAARQWFIGYDGSGRAISTLQVPESLIDELLCGAENDD